MFGGVCQEEVQKILHRKTKGCPADAGLSSDARIRAPRGPSLIGQRLGRLATRFGRVRHTFRRIVGRERRTNNAIGHRDNAAPNRARRPDAIRSGWPLAWCLATVFRSAPSSEPGCEIGQAWERLGPERAYCSVMFLPFGAASPSGANGAARGLQRRPATAPDAVGWQESSRHGPAGCTLHRPRTPDRNNHKDGSTSYSRRPAAQRPTRPHTLQSEAWNNPFPRKR